MFDSEFPQYGCFPRWPENGQAFIHPEDTDVVRHCIPSERVMRRDQFDGTYYHYRYGDVRFRLLPCLWLKIRSDGLDIGDRVETIGLGMELDLFIADVWGMHYVQRKGCIVYRLRRNGQVVPNLYTADQLRLITQKHHLRPSDTIHPVPTWNGAGDTLSDWDQ